MTHKAPSFSPSPSNNGVLPILWASPDSIISALLSQMFPLLRTHKFPGSITLWKSPILYRLSWISPSFLATFRSSTLISVNSQLQATVQFVTVKPHFTISGLYVTIVVIPPPKTYRETSIPIQLLFITFHSDREKQKSPFPYLAFLDQLSAEENSEFL